MCPLSVCAGVYSTVSQLHLNKGSTCELMHFLLLTPLAMRLLLSMLLCSHRTFYIIRVFCLELALQRYVCAGVRLARGRSFLKIGLDSIISADPIRFANPFGSQFNCFGRRKNFMFGHLELASDYSFTVRQSFSYFQTKMTVSTWSESNT